MVVGAATRDLLRAVHLLGEDEAHELVREDQGREAPGEIGALVDLLETMHDLPYLVGATQAELPGRSYHARRNAFAEALPQAGTGGAHDGRGGTLALRLRGSGLDVRAKTGTLRGVHGLSGVVVGRDGSVMLYAALTDRVKEPDVLFARAQLDRISSALAACRCGA